MWLDGPVEGGPFTPAEFAVLALADQIVFTNPDGHLDDELRARLAEHFSAEEIVELGMTGAVLAGMAKFLFVFDLVTRDTSCPIVRPAAK